MQYVTYENLFSFVLVITGIAALFITAFEHKKK